MELVKEIIINTTPSETRAAIIENEKLVEMHIERPENERSIGNIYAGFVENIVPGMNSVFVDIGEDLNGFSHLNEFSSTIMPEDILHGNYQLESLDKEITERQKIGNERNDSYHHLTIGEKIMVQVIKESIGTKGPRVTSKVSIPGRYIVLMPNERGVRISKKIGNYQERRRLKRIVYSLLPENFGIIIRTAAENKETQAFAKDIINTYNIWKKLLKKFNKAEKPGNIYKDYDLSASIVRDLFTEDIDCIRIDSPDLYEDVKNYVNDVSPELIDRVTLYEGKDPIFDAFYNINKEYYISLSREVFLKKGGSIVIDHTEALVAIDVNSKKYIRNKSHEENSLNINLQAAREVARQLRLRDLGGLVIIDFIDMEKQENKDKVYNELRGLLRRDKAKYSIEPIGRFGLVEMTRQRLKPSLVQAIYDNCPTCRGKGIIPSKESIAVQIDRWLKNFRQNSLKTKLTLKVNEDIYNFLTKGVYNFLTAAKIRYWLSIDAVVDNSLSNLSYKFYQEEGEKEITQEYRN